MDSIKWLKYHFTCPTLGIVNEKKTRKRDKSEVGLDVPPEIDSNNRQESHTITSSLNAYYNKHIEKHLKKDQHQHNYHETPQDNNNINNNNTNFNYNNINSIREEDINSKQYYSNHLHPNQFQQQQTITNKLKNKINFVSSSNKESKSFHNLQAPTKGYRNKNKNSKERLQIPLYSNPNCINQNLSSLDLNKSSSSNNNNNNNKSRNINNKLVTLPFDKKTRTDLDTSLLSNSSSVTQSTNSSTRTISNSSTASSSESTNQTDHLNKNYFKIDNSDNFYQLPNNNQTSNNTSSYNQSKFNLNNMIMTSNKTLGFSISSSSSSLIGSTSLQSSPVVQQPQFVSNSALNMSSSSSLSSPMTPTSNNTLVNVQPLTPTTNGSSTTILNSKITSLSYLDDSNLKIAYVDHNDLAKLIKLQNFIDPNEWLAFNTKMYFDQINVIYGAIAEHCTPQTCPTMNAPSNNQFYWLDEKGKKFKYSASQYIDTVLTYISKIISDESLFPIKHGHTFPSNFESLVKRIHKHLFQILAHMYHNHYKELVQLELNTYINSIYFHLYLFSKNFNTIDDKDLEIMDALNKSLVNKYIHGTNQQQQLLLNQQPPTIHQPTTSSSSSSGFSFFKKKLNFNLMA